ncbi:MAG: VOC family protein [Burkholderiaceae bacterium]|nr:VOC family protein [Burkholderiaceae bacterium]
MSSETQFIAATPVLASLDIERSVEFFRIHLGFNRVHAEQGVYGVVSRGAVHVHFWACDDRHIAENTSCRIRVQGLDALYSVCTAAGVVHPNAHLDEKPWGSKEFAVLDPDGNLITFAEWRDT